jgi:hypothetical protein
LAYPLELKACHTNNVSVNSLILQDLLKGKRKGFGVHRLKLYENGVLKKLSGFKKEKVTAGRKFGTLVKVKVILSSCLVKHHAMRT